MTSCINLDNPMKRHCWLLILLLAITGLLIWWRMTGTDTGVSDMLDSHRRPAAQDSSDEEPTTKIPKSEPDGKSTGGQPGAGVRLLALPRDMEVKVELPPRNKSFPQYGGGASVTQVIKNNAGDIIFEATPEWPFMGFYSREGFKDVIIGCGSGRFLLINPETGERTQLPVRPPGEHMYAFGSWEWLNEDTLFSSSGVKLLDREGNPRRGEGYEIAEGRLYAYRISTNELLEISLPAEVKGKPFFSQRFTADGFVELLSVSPERGEGGSLGWFMIEIVTVDAPK